MREEFERLFHELKPRMDAPGEFMRLPYAWFDGERAVQGSRLSVGFQVIDKPAVMRTEPHFHADEQYLIFMGAVWPDIFDSWDGEVWVYMGKSPDKMERIVITKPTIIHVPRGYFHCPIEVRRADKPILFTAPTQAGSVAAITEVRFPGGEKSDIYHEITPTGGGYPPYESVEWTVINENGGLSDEIRQYVLVIPREDTAHGPMVPSPQAYFRGKTYLDNATIHMGWQVIAGGPMPMENAHFHQAGEEYIFFTGANPADIFDFDAEISFKIGDSPDELEEKIITRPTVVRVPAFMWHCPINFTRVTKPLMFQAAFMDGVWGTIERRSVDGGGLIYSYMGDNVRFCVYDTRKTCNMCGKCSKNASAGRTAAR
ncbi:MAG: hypothetical protein LBD92_06700 [Oscillospiraceae bacterium]|nr:hypothetical protein [Oscillospiraceae bacterium]